MLNLLSKYCIIHKYIGRHLTNLYLLGYSWRSSVSLCQSASWNIGVYWTVITISALLILKWCLYVCIFCKYSSDGEGNTSESCFLFSFFLFFGLFTALCSEFLNSNNTFNSAADSDKKHEAFEEWFHEFHSPSNTSCVPLHYPLHQWSPTLGLRMFLDYNSQKPSPPPLLARISGSWCPRTSGGPRLGTTVLQDQIRWYSTVSSSCLYLLLWILQFPIQGPSIRGYRIGTIKLTNSAFR